jgi:DNA repair protein RadD
MLHGTPLLKSLSGYGEKMLDLFAASKPKQKINMRSYQEQAAIAVIQYLKANRGQNPIVCAATGTGKSIIIARLIERLVKANPDIRAMVGCHVAKLLKQNAEKLCLLMPDADIGFYSDSLDEKSLCNKFVFAGIQSIFRRKDIGKFNILIIDEVQSVSRKDLSTWGKLLAEMRAANPNLILIGFSATPWREDSGSLTSGDDALFHDIVFDYGLGMAVQDGYLCGFTSKYTKTEYDISGVKKIAGEYSLKDLETATNTDYLNQKAVTETIEMAKDRRAWLVFCNGVEHSFAIKNEMIRQGIPCETVTGETPESERDRILDDLESGKLRCVTNNGVWTTGVDAPFVDCIVMLRHTMSSGLLLQMAGRGTRLMIDVSGYETSKERRDAIAKSKKPNCLFLDFARNIERHGFLDQIKPKEKNKKGDGVAPMKACDECYTICHAAAKYCPDCGAVFPVNEKEILGDAYAGNILSGGVDERYITRVDYFPHNLNKEGKIPCLMVRYAHDDGGVTKEYICLQHSGFAGQKAEKWWLDRGGSPHIPLGNPQINIIELLVNSGECQNLKIPKKILVKKDGKYDRITSYEGLHHPAQPDPSAASAEEEDFDIPW